MDERCPRKLLQFPNEPCAEGREAIDLERKGEHGGCPWFINDREANYCFFQHMAMNGRPTDTATIARVLMMDDSEVKKTIQRFRKIAAKEFLEADSDPDVDPDDKT